MKEGSWLRGPFFYFIHSVFQAIKERKQKLLAVLHHPHITLRKWNSDAIHSEKPIDFEADFKTFDLSNLEQINTPVLIILMKHVHQLYTIFARFCYWRGG